MAETTPKAPKYAGPIGYRANGLVLEEIMLLDNGAVHTVYHDHKTHRICAGVMLDDFNPLTEKIYVYGRAGKALRDAGTSGKLSGTIDLVGPKGGMTDFGTALSGKTVRTVRKWINLLTFAGFNPDDLWEKCIAMNPIEVVNED